MSTSTKSPVPMVGRGARMFDLLMQKQLIVSPQLIKKRRASVFEEFQERDNKRFAKQEAEKEYFKLPSKLIHNPDASPSSGILRKVEFATPDSSPLSSAKRKRVGFSDPVSSTKEYVTDDEEMQKSSNLIRQLVYENDEDENDIKPIEEPVTLPVMKIEIQEEIEQPALMDHDYNESSQQQSADISTSDESLVDDGKLVFKDKNELLDYITKNLSIDEVFDKLSQVEHESMRKKELISKVAKVVSFDELLTEYFPSLESQNPKQNAQISTLINELTKLTLSNTSAKHKILAAMSANHKEEFLDVALQENSTSSICDKISVPKVIKYLVHKTNTDETSKNNESLINLNRVMVKYLISNTGVSNSEIFPDQKEVHELMTFLFKNKPKMRSFDIVQEFIRNLIQNH